MADFPYTQSHGNIKKLLEQIQSVGKPAKVTVNWLVSIGLKSSNDRNLLGLLKFIGFIDNTGTPTDVWKFATVEDLREVSTEHARIQGARDIDLCNKTQMKAFHGLLNKRNECAHPSDYYPSLNETLGYMSELLKRIEDVENKYRDNLLVPTL